MTPTFKKNRPAKNDKQWDLEPDPAPFSFEFTGDLHLGDPQPAHTVTNGNSLALKWTAAGDTIFNFDSARGWQIDSPVWRTVVSNSSVRFERVAPDPPPDQLASAWETAVVVAPHYTDPDTGTWVPIRVTPLGRFLAEVNGRHLHGESMAAIRQQIALMCGKTGAPLRWQAALRVQIVARPLTGPANVDSALTTTRMLIAKLGTGEWVGANVSSHGTLTPAAAAKLATPLGCRGSDWPSITVTNVALPQTSATVFLPHPDDLAEQELQRLCGEFHVAWNVLATRLVGALAQPERLRRLHLRLQED